MAGIYSQFSPCTDLTEDLMHLDNQTGKQINLDTEDAHDIVDSCDYQVARLLEPP